MPGPSRLVWRRRYPGEMDTAFFELRIPDTVKVLLISAIESHSTAAKKTLSETIHTYTWCCDLKLDLFEAWVRCCIQLKSELVKAASADSDRVSQIAGQVDNLVWLLDILIHRCVADEYVILWAEKDELLMARARASARNRYNISRITARLFMGIGEGKIKATSEAKHFLLSKWLVPFYEDFELMKTFRDEECHLMEDALSNTILTLTIPQQHAFLLAWADRFAKSGYNCCPILKRGVENLWRKEYPVPNKGSS